MTVETPSRGICRDICAGCASPAAFAETFAQAAQVPRYLPKRLRRLRKSHGICRSVCAGCASPTAFVETFAQVALGPAAFAETFAQAAQVPQHLPRRLRRSRKSRGICRSVCAGRAGFRGIYRGVCAGRASPAAFAETFAQAALGPAAFAEAFAQVAQAVKSSSGHACSSTTVGRLTGRRAPTY